MPVRMLPPVARLIGSTVSENRVGALRLYNPSWSSVDWRAVAVAALSAVLIFRCNWNVIKVLGISAVAGLLGWIG